MQSQPVDPRDQTWEIANPKYRVYFHDTDGASDEYEIDAGDASDAIAWAESQSSGRSFVLYACVLRDGLGLVRLGGVDPNVP